MGISNKTHGKKSDKETQSPMIKIFKEIMQRENRDPEKANLLKEKQENKKRKQYSGSRFKDHKFRTSSSSEYCKDTAQYKMAIQQQKDEEYSQYKSQSIPFQNEKRDSWWLWGDQEKKKSEETRSCVSCALKMFSTQYAGVVCLLLLFATTVIVTFLLVFRTIPVLSEGEELQQGRSTKYKNKIDGGQRFKKKIEMIKHKNGHDFGYDLKDFSGQRDNFENRAWSDFVSRDLNGLSAISGSEFGESNFRESSALDDPENRVFADLSNVLDKDKTGAGNEHLRSFYLKLLETDANIKKLKKGIFHHNYYNTMVTDNDNIYLSNMQNRLKRSLKHSNKSKSSIEFGFNKDKNNDILKRNANNNYIFYPPYAVFKRTRNFNNTERKKRDNDEEPSGFVIEKKKVIVQYSPEQRKKFPKCSHTPKESKSHEKQLKHPFYKNTQKLDELLDRFLDKKIPELITDPFGFDVYFKNNTKYKCKHDKLLKNKKYHPEENKLKAISTTDTSSDNTQVPYEAERHTKYSKDIFNNQFDFGKNLDRKYYTAKPSHDAATLVKPDPKKVGAPTNIMFDIIPNLRRLMQADDDDEESFGYEDLNEILADDLEAHDETDKQGDRRKRMNTLNLDQSDPQNHIPGVYNPNWKEPMLYPDELKTMIKQAVINNLRVKMPIINKVASEATNGVEINDVDYMEEYLSNKYDKLANMAQAYSDYGVLDGKNDILKNEKNQEKSMDHRVKLSVDKRDFPDATPFRNTEKVPSTSEGIRIEYRKHGSEDGLDVLKSLQKHLKFTKNKIFLNNHVETASSSNSGTPNTPILEILYTPTNNNYYKDETTSKSENLKEINKIIVPMGKLKRTLKSFEPDKYFIDNNEEFKIINERKAENSSKDKENVNKSDEMPIASEGRKEIDKKSDDSNTGMHFGDFLSMMADWFSTLASLDNKGGVKKNDSTNILDLLPILNKTAEISKENATVLMMYPIYDSDMIENIGHRSRVLMAVDDKAINISESDKSKAKKTTDDTSEKYNVVTSAFITTNTIQTGDISVNIIDSSANMTQSKKTGENTQTEKYKENDINNNTRAVFKRSVPEDSNLIFWNDIYDDEYGVKFDPFDGINRDKHSSKGDNVVKKSRKWIENKVKGIADSLRGKAKINLENKKRNIRGAHSYETDHLDSESLHNKINSKIDNPGHADTADIMETDVKSDFRALTAHMEKICQEAARAVQSTRNLAVREDNSEGAVATSLMHQLVRLMSDLVDYQVQQRSCLKLPDDLREFLEWLTTANQQNKYDYGKLKNNLQDEGLAFLENIDKSDHQTELDAGIWTTSPNEKEQDIYDTRSQCLGSIDAVQDLMRQYNEMSDGDKEKMIGVKEYLSNQLEYLNKQLLDDEYNVLYQKDYLTNRIRRDLSNRRDHKERSNKNEERRIGRFKNRCKRKRGKFMRNFGKKHTKSTASNFDLAEMITEGNKKTKRDDPECKIDPITADHNVDKDEKFNVDKTTGVNYMKSTEEDSEVRNPKMKRNLKDIYYKALAESKKYTTVKNDVHRIGGNLK